MIEHILADHILIGLILAYVGYAAFRSQPQIKGVTLDTGQKLQIYWSNGVLLWIGALGVAATWLFAGRSLESLGITWHHESLGRGLAITTAFLVVAAADSWRRLATTERRRQLLARWRRDIPFLPENPRELRHFSFMAITAGITEEIIARGFAIAYLIAFAGDSWTGLAVAVTIPAVAFAFAHRYEGWKDMIRIFVLAIAFGAIFVVTESLLIPILLHSIVDIAAGLLSQGMVREAARTTDEPTDASDTFVG